MFKISGNFTFYKYLHFQCLLKNWKLWPHQHNIPAASNRLPLIATVSFRWSIQSPICYTHLRPTSFISIFWLATYQKNWFLLGVLPTSSVPIFLSVTEAPWKSYLILPSSSSHSLGKLALPLCGFVLCSSSPNHLLLSTVHLFIHLFYTLP